MKLFGNIFSSAWIIIIMLVFMFSPSVYYCLQKPQDQYAKYVNLRNLSHTEAFERPKTSDISATFLFKKVRTDKVNLSNLVRKI